MAIGILFEMVKMTVGLSTICFLFHNFFFPLSVSEQMTVTQIPFRNRIDHIGVYVIVQGKGYSR
jgi:hypothetical protein